MSSSESVARSRILSVRTHSASDSPSETEHTRAKLRAIITRSKRRVRGIVSVLEWARRARKLNTQEEDVVDEVVSVSKLVSNKSQTRNNVCFLYDSGSDAHVTNDKSVFIDGTLKSCDVSVFGISDDDSVSTLKAVECGDVAYTVGKNEIVLRDVLLVRDAVLGVDPNDTTVLVSVGKMVRGCGFGVHFVAGGGRVELTTGSGGSIKVEGKFISNELNLFTDYGSHTTVRQSKTDKTDKTVETTGIFRCLPCPMGVPHVSDS